MMWFWARDWMMIDTSDGDFHDRPLLIDTRPRLSQHGGATRPAVERAEAAPEGADG